MPKCPVCDTPSDHTICPACGFDRSRDYEHWPTFGPVRGAVSAAGLRAQRAPKDAMRCPECGGAAFTIRVPDGARRCQGCGWTPEPQPRLSCGCGSTYFAVRMSDGALECPLCGGTIALKQLNAWFPGSGPQPEAPKPEKTKTPPSPESVYHKDKPKIVGIAAGGQHTAALYSDGTVRAIGSNMYGQCDVKAWKNITAITAGYSYTAGKRDDGSWVVAGRDKDHVAALYNNVNIVAVADGPDHRATMRTDGIVRSFFKEGTPKDASTECLKTSHWFAVGTITAIAAGRNQTLGLTSAGKVLTTLTEPTTRNAISSWRDITAVAAGHSHAVGLKKDGTVMFTGTYHDGRYGRIGALRQWKDITAIAAGSSFTVGLKKDGTLVACGTDVNGACDIEKLMTP